MLALLVDRSDLGTIRLEQPTLQIIFSGPQSNLEEAFAGWQMPRNAVRLEVADAQVLLHDADSEQQWTFSAVNLGVTIPRSGSGATQFALCGRLAQPSVGGKVDVEGVLPRAASAAGQLRIELDTIPLALLLPLLRRVEPDLRLAGQLTGHLTCSWQSEDAGARRQLNGSLRAHRFSVEGPWLGQDHLALENVELTGHGASQASQLHLEHGEIRCDLGHALLDGTLDIRHDLATMLSRSQYELRADLDVARTAIALSHALPVRTDTTLTGGQVHLELSSSAGTTATRWKGQLQTSELAATAQGQRIVWPEPLAVAFTAHQAADQAVVLDHFRCASEFLQLEASGSRDGFSATASYNLDRLAERLHGFVELASLRLTGTGLAHVNLTRSSDGRFQVHGEAELRQLQLVGWNGWAWQENHLTLWIDAAGSTETGGRRRLDAASLRLQENEEQLEVRLLEPVADVLYASWGPLSLFVRGDLAQWQRRRWPQGAGPGGWQLAGQGELRGRVCYRPRKP